MDIENNDIRIREIAYGFWLEEGQPPARDEEHWHRALAALNAKAKPTRIAAVKPRAVKKAAPKTAATPKT